MPVIWQSSQQPMYIKTVWVHGFRHAVLTKDDPYFKINKQRPRSAYIHCRNQEQEPRNEHLNYRNKENHDDLHLMVTNNKPIQYNESVEDDIESLDLSVIEEPEHHLLIQSKTAPLNELDTHRSRFNCASPDMKTLRSNRTARTDTVESTDLSDRVLQWLDLAGKSDLLVKESDDTKRLAQPRHSWPEIRKHATINKKEIPESKIVTEEALVHPRKDIDPQTSPPSASTSIEHYARQTRHVKISRDVRNRDNKTKATDIKAKIQEARQRVAAEKQEVQKQYAELLSKKILPESNAKAKKQVHIFMPVSKKSNSNLSAITESLLSQSS